MTAPPRPNPRHVPPRRYTTQQVADLFAVSPRAVRRWERAGILTPAIRTPGDRGGWRNQYDAGGRRPARRRNPGEAAMSADYEPVRKALSEGLDPAMLCQTCPWNRPCISPPTMTKAEIDEQIAKASRDDEARAEEARRLGRDPGLPTGMLITALAVGARDTQAHICPVFALRLRSSAGRGIADRLRESMQGWDDQS